MATALDLPSRVEGRSVLSLRRQLFASLQHDADLVVDCSRVQYLSPAGQALLVAAERTARRRGGHLHLSDPSAAMLAALRSTGLSHLLARSHPPRTAPHNPIGR